MSTNIIALFEEKLANFNAWIQQRMDDEATSDVEGALLITLLKDGTYALNTFQLNTADAALLSLIVQEWAMRRLIGED